MSRKRHFHPIHQSCIYKLASRKRLAEVLPASVKALQSLSKTENRYECWDKRKESGGTRRIEAPHDNLKIVQKRIADLLQRIETPEFLMSPKKGRSYVDNAATHLGAKAFRLLDIEDFFPSCTDRRVYWFFSQRMGCSPDVAALLTRLTTFNGRLPQGSPCSPILAYFAYEDMWARIDQIVAASGCALSIYADDITISGDVVYGNDVWAVKSCLFRYGFRYSAKKERSLINRPADVTGAIVNGQTLLLPNRQHKKLAEVERELRNAQGMPQMDMLRRQLRGREAQAKQITQHVALAASTK